MGIGAAAGLQRCLAVLGYPIGPLDGQLGPVTQHCVREFQVHRRLTVDGVAGTETLAELARIQQLIAAPRVPGYQRPAAH